MSTTTPHNLEAEKAVLGSLIVDPGAHSEVQPTLMSADFYVGKHQRIYTAICAIVARGEQADIITLRDELRRRGWLEEVGGDVYLSELAEGVPRPAYAAQYARQVLDAATRRRLLYAANEVERAAHDTTISVDDALTMAETAVLSLRRASGSEVDAQSLMERLHGRVTDWQENPLAEGETRGLATGIRPLDKALGGLEPGLFLLAARPSMGKTALTLQVSSNIAGRNQRVIFFSLEMSPEQVGLRLACTHARVELDRLKRGVVAPEEYERVITSIGAISEWPLIIHTGGFRAGDVRAIIQREQRRGEVAAVFVDGLWLMAASKDVENRNLELGSISRELKLAADALGVPIVAVHQLSRAVEQRADKRPLMSDLRESGRLEEDADVILMLYREGYYSPGSPEANVAEIWIRKNRLGGPSGRCVKLFWLGKYMQFAELQRSEAAE